MGKLRKTDTIVKISSTIIFTIIAVIGFIKGNDYYVLKKGTAEKTSNIITRINDEYLEELKALNKEIREIDIKLENEGYKGSYGWEKLIIIKDDKIKQRDKIIEILNNASKIIESSN